MQNQNKDKKEINKYKDTIKLLDSSEDLVEVTKIKEHYERLQKMDEDDHLTHLTRCIKCGKKIEMYTYFCNSTCDDEYINEKAKEKENEKEKEKENEKEKE
jgi:hypothetical protein